MKSPGLRKAAIDEMAKERARAFGKKHKGKSPLEKDAEAAKSDFEYQKTIQSKPETVSPVMDNTTGLEFKEVSAREFQKERPSGSILDSWMLPKKEKEEVKPRTINTATVVAIRKKLMAQEWRRALGISRPDPRMVLLDKEASQWKERREARERQEAEEKRRMEELRGQLQACLRVFRKKLYEVRHSLTPDIAVQLFEEAFDTLGQVVDLKWEKDGCRAVIEPWEEKKRRRREHLPEPILYELCIDQELNISSYEKIKDEKRRRAEEARYFLKPLTNVIREKSPQVGIKVLEEGLSEAGRIVTLDQQGDRWKAVVEPWEEMRVRNIERGGHPPVVTYDLKFDTDLQLLGSRKVVH